MRALAVIVGFSLLGGCAAPKSERELRVAAASNLAQIVPEISRAFERETGVRIVASYGPTAQLARQIENGAPLDVFLAADVQHVDELAAKRQILAETRIVYARGRLAVWAPNHPEIHSLQDLAGSSVRTIAIAKPELAPYGKAAVEALRTAGLWDNLEKKVVYAQSIAAAKQLADTGNAEAAITATSLLVGAQGNSFPVNPSLYSPIAQAACVTTQAQDRALAARFLRFLAGEPMQNLFRRYGYIAG